MIVFARACVLALLALAPFAARADTRKPAIEGVVSSIAEGAMEGVVVTARRAGSPISVSVVSDERGRFAFPSDRLATGDYSLAIRAVGYELASGAALVHVGSDASAAIDLALAPASDISVQLTNTEWFMSLPGSARDKLPLATCMTCHSLERVVKSRHSAAEWIDVLDRMVNFAYESDSPDTPRRSAPREIPAEKTRALATYLASINLSKGALNYALKTLPRPSGRATRVIITEYHMPRATTAPHDARRDADGFVWFSNSAEQSLGRLDPVTGNVADFPAPTPRPDLARGGLALEADAAGNLWLAMMYQGGLARFDRATGAFRLFPVAPELNGEPPQQSMVMPGRARADGKVWTNDVNRRAILRLDPATGLYEVARPFADAPGHTPYGLATDDDDNLWFMDFGAENIGKVEARTLSTTLFATPTRGSHPRRGMFDGRNIWFAEFAVNKLGVFDTIRERFREWDAPTPYSFPYDAHVDRNGDLWSGNMSNDRVLRLRPDTGETVEYPLPRSTNIRRVFIDNTTERPTLWAGNNHGASIIRLEPLD